MSSKPTAEIVPNEPYEVNGRAQRPWHYDEDEVLLALAATVRSPDAPRESIVALLQTAKTALAHYLSPAQRRRLETTASTIRATRAS